MIKMLIVDDEIDICDSLVDYFKNYGYDVKGAHNSKEAFSALDEYKPDIAVLDINLKEKYNGIDILKKGLELYPGMKAIMLTGVREGYETEESMRQGAKMIVTKPIKIAGVREAVEKVQKSIG